MLCSWIVDLPRLMEKYGMRVAAIERKMEPAFHHTIVTYNFCQVFEEYANVFLDTHGSPGSGDATRNLAQSGFQEALDGSYTAHVFQTVVAERID